MCNSPFPCFFMETSSLLAMHTLQVIRKFQPLFGLLVAFMTFSLQPIVFADCKRSKIEAIFFIFFITYIAFILAFEKIRPLIFFQVFKRSIELKAPVILVKNYMFLPLNLYPFEIWQNGRVWGRDGLLASLTTVIKYLLALRGGCLRYGENSSQIH